MTLVSVVVLAVLGGTAWLITHLVRGGEQATKTVTKQKQDKKGN